MKTTMSLIVLMAGLSGSMALAGGDSHPINPVPCGSGIDGNSDCPGSEAGEKHLPNQIRIVVPKTKACPKSFRLAATADSLEVRASGSATKSIDGGFGPAQCLYKIESFQTSAGFATPSATAIMEVQSNTVWIDFALGQSSYRLRIFETNDGLQGNLNQMLDLANPYDVISVTPLRASSKLEISSEFVTVRNNAN